MDTADTPFRCSRCGAALARGELGGLCPSCLLALEVDGSLPSTLSERTALGVPSSQHLPNVRLAPGQVLGRFRIETLLGVGGMGEVYSAQQIDDGRRVALKVLRARLTDRHDRTRFLREGQLAASISHPNSVYVYGSEEIDGVPIITMELLSGGTLKDRVKREGPLPPAEAVDVILQVVAGLDAAQTAGILHRDVKPSNCFMAADGTVKVGDFGLSISTLARDTTQSMHAGFQGTPQFAAPEQLQGAALDVRTDIYAVGATLFYLLTGTAPFEGPDLATVVLRAKSERPRSPRELDRRIPRGLCRIVLQCLEKDSALRPASYAALARELRPYMKQAMAPAELGLRFAAGVMDAALLMALVAAGSLAMYMIWGDRSGAGLEGLRVLMTGRYILASITYFAILEGIWTASLGKRVVGLRIARTNDDRRSGLRAAVRASVFCLPNIVVLLVTTMGVFDGLWAWRDYGLWVIRVLYLDPLLYLSILAALFAGARRHNGFAALHDRLSGTRVVAQVPSTDAAANSPASQVVILPLAHFRRGPFEVRGSIRSTTNGELLDAFDPVLRRRVWIHEVPPLTSPPSLVGRDHSRRGELHWLGGVRSEIEAWDAYEALDGSPLSDVLKTDASWSRVKRWLADLSIELEAAQKKGPVNLASGRVWITGTDHAKYLDFEIAGQSPTVKPTGATPLHLMQEFLSSIAEAALRGPADQEWRGRLRLPLHAQVLLNRLKSHDFGSVSEVVADFRKAAALPDQVTTERRAAHIGLMAVPVACTIVAFALVEPIPNSHGDRSRLDLSYFLHTLKEGNEKPGTRFPTIEGSPAVIDKVDLEALEVYVLGRFGTMLDSEESFFSGRDRWITTIDRTRARHPYVTADEFTAASRRLQRFLADLKARNDYVDAAFDSAPFEWWQLAGVLSVTLHLSMLAALLSGILVPGGLMLAGLGMALVRRDGSPISRVHSLVRTFVAWSPFFLIAIVEFLLPAIFGDDLYWFMYERLSPTRVIALGMLVMFAGACAAVISPQRGIQDRIAGTWLVPR